MVPGTATLHRGASVGPSGPFVFPWCSGSGGLELALGVRYASVHPVPRGGTGGSLHRGASRGPCGPTAVSLSRVWTGPWRQAVRGRLVVGLACTAPPARSVWACAHGVGPGASHRPCAWLTPGHAEKWTGGAPTACSHRANRKAKGRASRTQGHCAQRPDPLFPLGRRPACRWEQCPPRCRHQFRLSGRPLSIDDPERGVHVSAQCHRPSLRRPCKFLVHGRGRLALRRGQLFDRGIARRCSGRREGLLVGLRAGRVQVRLLVLAGLLQRGLSAARGGRLQQPAGDLLEHQQMCFPNLSFLRPDEVSAVRAGCPLYTSPSPRDRTRSRIPSSA